MEEYFGALDIVVFTALLVASASIGTYFAYKDRKDNTTDTYYYGNRKLSAFPVGMSLAVSFISAITMIGYPVEAYLFGIVFLWFIPGITVAVAIASVYYIPLVHRLKLATIYEYLERRFNKLVREFCSGAKIIETVIYMSVAVYLPALALEAVTPISLNWSIALTTLICTFYTSLGGMKAVMWTDVLQGSIMIFGALALFIKTVVEVGGFGNVAEAVERGGRNNFFKFDADPRVRSSALTMCVGMAVASSIGTCASQVYVQRYLSCRTARDAQKAMVLRAIFEGTIICLVAACGLAMYTYYEYCDPKSAGFITKYDQTAPRLAIEVFRDMPGMAGLFVSAAYSGTLSTVSSGINATAAMTTEDFIIPRWPNLSAKKRTVASKGFSVLYGILVTVFAILISFISSTIFELAMALLTIIGGPILAVYTAGVFTPWCSSIGATVGLVIGWVVTCWVSVSSVLHHTPPEFYQILPVTTEGCNLTTNTQWNVTSEAGTTEAWVGTTEPANRPPLADTLYAISPFLIGAFGLSVTFISINLVSVVTGVNRPKDADPELFVPILDNKKVFPKSVIKFFRFGVPQRSATPLKADKAHENCKENDVEIRLLST